MPPKNLNDSIGQKIPTSLWCEFKNGEEMRKIAAELKALAKKIKARCHMARGYEKVSAKRFVHYLSEASSELYENSPWTVCRCGAKNSCHSCQGRGFLTHDEWTRWLDPSSVPNSGGRGVPKKT